MQSLQECWDADHIELERSEKVQGQLRAVLKSLEQKCSDLEAENRASRSKAADDPRFADLQQEASAAAAALAASEAQLDSVLLEIRSADVQREEHEARAEACRLEINEAHVAHKALTEACTEADAQCQQTLAKGRSMVTAEASNHGRAQAMELRSRLEQQEAETSRLRGALADSWASRVEPENSGLPDAKVELKALDNVEEELKWLAEMQQKTSKEVHHVQHLEHTEAALNAKLIAASEEHAALQSAKMDIDDAGRAMREVVVASSDRFVQRVDGLAEARRITDKDRAKLLSECVDLQARLDSMSSVLSGVSDLEGRHAKLEAERRALADESIRLRAVNAALGAQLLGDASAADCGEGSTGSATECISRVLQLQRRLHERIDSQSQEKQKLSDRIRALEREVVQGVGQTSEEPATQALSGSASSRTSKVSNNKAARNEGPLSSAKSVLRTGLGRLRDAL